MATLEEVLRDFERRLSALEERFPPGPETARTAARPPLRAQPEAPEAAVPKPEAPRESPGTLFGIVGIGFLLVAAIFFLKLSIDSGWLTPERQVLLLGLAGLACLLTPHWIPALRDSYGALLSGTGAAILHFTWFGAYVFYHMLPPSGALAASTAVGVLSILLNVRMANSVFVTVAIAGTYLSSLSLPQGAGDLSTVSGFFLIWNLSFSALSLLLQRRDVLIISAFFAVIIAGIVPMRAIYPGAELAQAILLLQGLQFAIFASAMMIFSYLYRSPLTTAESWNLCLLLLWYYGNIYWLVSIIDASLAPALGISVGVLVLALQRVAQKWLIRGVESSEAIATFATVVLVHSLYLKTIPYSFQPLASLGVALLFAYFHTSNQWREWRFVKMIALTVVGYGAVLSLIGPFAEEVNLAYHAGFGLLAIALAVAALKFSRAEQEQLSLASLLANFGHVEILVGLYRLSPKVGMSGSLFVSLAWGLYGLAVLGLAYLIHNRKLGQSAVVILAAVSLKGAFYDIAQASSLTRVLSLVIAGLLLYLCGWIFQQMQKWESA